MRKKLLITYASYGNGHKSAALSIYYYFKEKNYEIKLIDVLDYGNIILKLDKKNFELNYKYQLNHFLFNTLFELSDNNIITAPYKVLTKLFKSNLKQEILDFNPDILISTHFFGSIFMGIIKNKYNLNTKIITIVTDYKAHTLWLRNNKFEDVIVVGNEQIKDDLIKYGINKDKIYPLGIPISKKFDMNNINLCYKFNNSHKTVLFLGGGAYGSNFSFSYLKHLIEAKLPINILFVAGNNLKLKQKCEKYIKDNNVVNIKIFGFSNDIPSLLKTVDVVITKPGGISITEAMKCRTPLVLIPGNGGPENYNAKFIVENEFGLNSKNPKQLCLNIKTILNNENLLVAFKNNLKLHFKNKTLDELYNLVKEMDGKI